MRVVLFYHSLRSDWNHGNAHFLRGVVTELLARGHHVRVLEPHDAWSALHLRREHGEAALDAYRDAYPGLTSRTYHLDTLDLDDELGAADVVLVHEWNDPALVRRIGAHRAAAGGYRLLFHDTHHRAVTQPESMAAYDLRHYDGALVFGRAIRDIYVARGWVERVWVWHEAADTRVFQPRPEVARDGDVVWIGNWGDEERTAELREFLVEPVRSLRLRARVHGVRYPDAALRTLSEAGIEFGGWIPNHRVPDVFGRFHATIHVPRGPYVRALPGIPTIRVFEALACGIPLVSAPWDDAEELFAPGDFLVACDGRQMRRLLRGVVRDRELARFLSERGVRAIRERHTCAHRVDELEAVLRELGPGDTGPARPDAAVAADAQLEPTT